MKPERECSPIQAVMEPMKGLSLGTSSAMEDVMTSAVGSDSCATSDQPSTAGVHLGQYQDISHDMGAYQQDSPNMEQCQQQQQIHDSGQYGQQSSHNNNNDITINFNKHYSNDPYDHQNSMSGEWSFVPQSPFNVFNSNGNGSDDSISDQHQENMIEQQQQNLSQFQEGMSQLQQDMTQARMTAECPLQSVYLERLQELVPWVPKDEELPKLQLVQAVIDYINLLQEQLAGGGGGGGGAVANNDVRCQGFGVVGGYCQDPLTVDSRIECSDVNSCNDSSEASPPPPPPPSPPRVVGSGGGGQDLPPHLFTHLQEKQMVNELSQLQMVTTLGLNDTASPVGAQDATQGVDAPHHHYHVHHHHQHQHMVDGFSNEHQQLMSDLRHLKMKDPVSEQHMVGGLAVGGREEQGAGGNANASNGCTHATLDTNVFNGCTPRNSGAQYSGAHQQMYSGSHHHAMYSAPQHQQDPAASSAQQYPQPHPVSIFPFPAPPSPQTIKAARKKKMLLKKQQQQQQQQDFSISDCYPISMQ